MKTSGIAILLLALMSGCQFSKSVNKDLLSGLLTKGDGISCDEVYLTIGDKKINRNTFVYGETFVVNFNKIEGFNNENESVFPDMSLLVLSMEGDTMLFAEDLYSNYPDGIKLDPLLLTSEVTVAAPMRSGREYKLNVGISDKKGDGAFSAGLAFKVVSSDKIITESTGVGYNEIYLYSGDQEKVIVDNKVGIDETTYFVFEGLTGFKEDGGMVYPGLSIKGTDKGGKLILDFKDLFADYSETGLSVTDFNKRVLSNFTLSGTEILNPLHCEILIWDKKGDAKIKSAADLEVRQ
ncbi:MAG: hypothetical protein A2X05_17930 [Bacteroidetes bacterium GWE2_41_25]|nr:MAG: hypothetical protein A2X03_06190 [Bacteroidetes bacterium GWA2_40_15]OFX98014.1 MAG: hypothetical protein A2X06_12960 [Bacteroidetes bacterium GWC2_40_22]OFX99126.1 MAG: hypothetical protein A2X05_17930 [Bacteroidetes bacterium GWE2_41_25]OFY57961.1 MAG: hypothetical protein A2X04_06300 [Bacteroidetes bacterium GWF2_41_9]HBH84849.1 hypothetical protein [Bacteroidales bacterium]